MGPGNLGHIQYPPRCKAGGVTSATEYKQFINPLLDVLSASGLGSRIGTVSIAAPTCADDVALLAYDQHELQILLDLAFQFSQREGYRLQPKKCMVVRYGPAPGSCIEWRIGPDKIPTDDQAAHIGVVRDSSTGGSAATCLNNLSKANKAFFAKFSQMKDTTPQAALAIYQSSILPILTYGLEVIIHVPKYISLLQDAQDYFLKQIAGLPTSGVAAYTTELLTGMLPVEAIAHKRTLGLLGNVVAQSGSLEIQIITRQSLHVQMTNKLCWVAQAKRLLALYDLPSILALIQSPPSKLHWKQTVTKAVNRHWEDFFTDNLPLFPSLRMCNTTQYTVGTPHVSLASVSTSPMDVKRARVKVKILTGSYPLQANRPNFNQFCTPVCVLCKKEPEDRMHFLLRCESLQTVRTEAWRTLHGEASDILNVNIDILPQKSSLQLIIDPKYFVLLNPHITHHKGIESLERASRWYCYRLHTARKQLLPLIPRRKRAKKVFKPGRYNTERDSQPLLQRGLQSSR